MNLAVLYATGESIPWDNSYYHWYISPKTNMKSKYVQAGISNLTLPS